MLEPIENLYFNWLYEQVSDVNTRLKNATFNDLFRVLHTTEFVFLLSGDDNRAEDGLELRQAFLIDAGLEEDQLFLNQPCSVLEMLVAFSRRASFETDDTPAYWFWIMLSNLGLSSLNDAHGRTNERYIHDVLACFMSREYDPSGRGGLFPLDYTDTDQRNVEIWYQFNEYLFVNGYA